MERYCRYGWRAMKAPTPPRPRTPAASGPTQQSEAANAVPRPAPRLAPRRSRYGRTLTPPALARSACPPLPGAPPVSRTRKARRSAPWCCGRRGTPIPRPPAPHHTRRDRRRESWAKPSRARAREASWGTRRPARSNGSGARLPGVPREDARGPSRGAGSPREKRARRAARIYIPIPEPEPIPRPEFIMLPMTT